MDITLASPSYQMEARTPVSVASTNSAEGAPTVERGDALPAPQDRVTISQEAQDKLAAETAGGNAQAKPGAKPSDSKMFVYGALGLERPDKKETKPDDGYTYGRYLAAAVTLGAMAALL